MKAVIMAGGMGTRLHPLTEHLPKPMVRLCGRPVIEYILDLLLENGIRESVLTLQYLPHLIEAHFPGGEYCGMRLAFSTETQPLGTAGSVRFAADAGEEVLVISGDALCDLPLSQAVEMHRETGADATIVTVRVDDPREYGMVISSADGKISGFVEKPSFTQVTSELANTGIYILTPKALSMIPCGKMYDFACNLFPDMLARGMHLQNCTLDGYWCDIGDLDTYRRAQQDILERRVRCSPNGARDQSGNLLAANLPNGAYTVHAPVYIGAEVAIGEGAVIGPAAVLDEGCAVASGATVRGSVLLPGCAVGERASADGAVICPDAAVQSGCLLEEGCAIGGDATLGEGCRVWRGMRVACSTQVAAHTVVSSHIGNGGSFSARFDDDGLCGEIGPELTPEVAVRVGCAVGTAAGGKTVGIATDNSQCMRILSKAVAAAICSAGAGVIDFGCAQMPVFSFGMRYNALTMGVYLQAEQGGAIRIISEAGLPIPRRLERQIETMLARGDYRRAAENQFGEYISMSGIGAMYTTELLRLAPDGLEGMAVRVKCRDSALTQMLGDVLKKLGCNVGAGRLTLQLSRDAGGLTLLEDDVEISPHRVVAAYCLAAFRQGMDVAVAHDFPRGLDALAAQHGRTVHRYFSSSADSADSHVRALAAAQQAPRDGLMLAVMLLDYLRRNKLTLSELDRQLPAFSVEEQFVEISVPPIRLLSQFPSEQTGEGILVKNDRGTVFMRSCKRGNAIRVFAEAVNAETARELCFDFTKLLKDAQSNLKLENSNKK